MTSSIAEKVISIVAAAQQLEPDQISHGSTFEELGIDSLQGLNIIYELETEFDIEIPNERALNIGTVAQLTEELEQFLQESPDDAPSAEHSEPTT